MAELTHPCVCCDCEVIATDLVIECSIAHIPLQHVTQCKAHLCSARFFSSMSPAKPVSVTAIEATTADMIGESNCARELNGA